MQHAGTASLPGAGPWRRLSITLHARAPGRLHRLACSAAADSKSTPPEEAKARRTFASLLNEADIQELAGAAGSKTMGTSGQGPASSSGRQQEGREPAAAPRSATDEVKQIISMRKQEKMREELLKARARKQQRKQEKAAKAGPKGEGGAARPLAPPPARVLTMTARAKRQLAGQSKHLPTREERHAESQGIKREYKKAQALPPGEWQRLKEQYLATDFQMKLGRRGATPQIAAAMHAAWRTREVVKLRIHDDKSSRQANLPRLNLLLLEIEEQTGGTVVEVQGSSIWVYRGLDYKAPPRTIPRPLPPRELLMQPQHEPLGAWRELPQEGWRTAYPQPWEKRREGEQAPQQEQQQEGSRRIPTRVYEVGPADAPAAVVVFPDLFPLSQQYDRITGGQGPSQVLQCCDRLAQRGGLRVLLVDVMQEEVAWPWRMWPPKSTQKVQFDTWQRTGNGSWLSVRDSAIVAVKEAAGPDGSRPVGVLGFGWGAYAAVKAAGRGDLLPMDELAAEARKLDQAAEEAARQSAGLPAAEQRTIQQQNQARLAVGEVARELLQGAAVPYNPAVDRSVPDGLGAAVKAAACAGAQWFGGEDDMALKLQCPVAVVAGRHDLMDKLQLNIQRLPASEEEREALRSATNRLHVEPPLAAPWRDLCAYKRWGSVPSSFTTINADFEDHKHAAAATEAIEILADFMRARLLGQEWEMPEWAASTCMLVDDQGQPIGQRPDIGEVPAAVLQQTQVAAQQQPDAAPAARKSRRSRVADDGEAAPRRQRRTSKRAEASEQAEGAKS